MSVFPLKSVYSYLEKNGFADLRNETDKLHSPDGDRDSTLRRGRIILFLEKESLLNDFLEKYWPEGKTPKGKSNMNTCKNFYRKVIGFEEVFNDKSDSGDKNISRRATVTAKQIKQTYDVSQIVNFSESHSIIAREAKELIRLINQNCKNLGRESIFKDSGLFELWMDIEKFHSSRKKSRTVCGTYSN